ncbi:MAG: PDZ domain-containing protein [Acidimicrobiaceae bacterium]|nr:trypsin-like peptidase domain-containing protein [Acidimicrobiaceae bacterium]MDE0516116.1 trypsin-like peptidase domain-containing protein [Acidimicrobiaceae bacterium]MDE0655646.1 trypsin-like peptidase domain-containing protein [Acidimicrobiaceae bacterium]MXZ94525.1 PDZ domain-containing protein [Acidimicrobiaceae bacterium]MYF42606.1 PDZ domain-containing protein [Acidimicrobiaceae bacterium]
MQDSEAVSPTAVVRPPEAAVAARRPAWKVAGALVLACLVLVAGTALGLVLFDDPQGAGPTPQIRLATPEEIPPEPAAAAVPAKEAATPDGPAVALAESIPDAAAAQYPAPVVSEEPVVAVAEALSPSVVLVEVDAPIGFGLGSGIVWDAQNGYIVTNHHVVEGVDDVVVTLSDGTRLDGEVIGGSSGHDVAVVRVDPGAAELVAATFAPASSVRVGQLAVAIGSPLGLTGTVTAGIVSAVRIQVQGGSDPNSPVPVEMIQTDAAINRGNSGGALADWQGRVIGMNTMIQTTSGGNIGLGFAVPSDTVDLIATRIVKGESLELGYLGISGRAADGDIAGVVVVQVLSGSPAQEAGLLAGDIIVSLDAEPMKDIAELAAAIKLRRPGEAVELTIRRGDDVYLATAVLDALG